MYNDNPFFMDTLDETGEYQTESIPRSVLNNEPIPAEQTVQTFPYQDDEKIVGEAVGVNVGPQGMPKVGPEVDLRPLSTEEIEKQIAELDAAIGEEDYSEGFVDSLKEVENSVKAGYDEVSDTWTPHTSIEGGGDTLGYGHKLTPSEIRKGKVKLGDEWVDYKEGLTNKDVDELLRIDISKAEDKVSKIKGYKDFDRKYKDILINIVFNTGNVSERKWPKLLKAIRAGDDEAVKEEMVTSYTDAEGNRYVLQRRADVMSSIL